MLLRQAQPCSAWRAKPRPSCFYVSKSVSRCSATRRNMEPVEGQQQLETAASSSTDVSVAVPAEPLIVTSGHQTKGFGGMNVAGVLVAAVLAAGYLYKRMRSSGYDPFMKDVMSQVNTVHMEELPSELIEAARARRSRERANYRLDLDEVELPENHPWATRKPVTAEQEAAIQARLQVRPRRAAGGGDMQPGQRRRQLSRE